MNIVRRLLGITGCVLLAAATATLTYLALVLIGR